MAAGLLMDETPRDRLRRLAVVFAIELRVKIVVELYSREMSAIQFFREFGGGSPTRVYKNFIALAERGWLRLLYSAGPGGRRRGGVEQFYRATEPPIVDATSWALLPYSVRLTSSWNLLHQIAPRLRGDLEACCESGGRSRDLTCKTFLLDEQGWNRVIGAGRTRFTRGFEEQEDARRRALHTGEELFQADVFLIAFQSFTNMQPPLADLLLERHREPLIAFPERLAPIMGDDVCLGIASALNQGETSVTQFHREFGGASKPMISRRFKGLEAGGWAAKDAKKSGGTRRGAAEQFYRPTRPAMGDFKPLAEPPTALVGTENWEAFERLCEELKEAMISGAFDTRTDRCLTWSLLRLDKQGWERIIAEIESLLDFAEKEQAQATLRMERSGETPIPMTLGLAAFEALKETIKAP